MTTRTEQVFRWLPAILLAVSVLVSLAVPEARDGAGGAILGAGAVLGVSLAVGERLMGDAPGGRPAAGWFAIHAAAMIAMCVLAPLFGFGMWTCFLLAARIFTGRWLVAGVAATAAGLAVSQMGGDLSDGVGAVGLWLGLTAANGALAALMYWLTAEDERHARETGISDERARLAREIHDTLAQGLAGIITQLEAAEGGDWRRHHDAALRLARESLTEARRSVDALRPEPLERARLTDAIAKVAADWTALHGVPAAVTTTGEVAAQRPEVEVALLRTAQEALANVARHASASRVGLTLTYMGDCVLLDVRDDGVGFVPAEADGFGLVAMRQRVAALQGTLAVESAPGAGTALSASLPARPVA